MTEESKEILELFCAPIHSLVNVPTLLIETHPHGRNSQGLSGILFENKATKPLYVTKDSCGSRRKAVAFGITQNDLKVWYITMLLLYYML